MCGVVTRERGVSTVDYVIVSPTWTVSEAMGKGKKTVSGDAIELRTRSVRFYACLEARRLLCVFFLNNTTYYDHISIVWCTTCACTCTCTMLTCSYEVQEKLEEFYTGGQVQVTMHPLLHSLQYILYTSTESDVHCTCMCIILTPVHLLTICWRCHLMESICSLPVALQWRPCTWTLV